MQCNEIQSFLLFYHFTQQSSPIDYKKARVFAQGKNVSRERWNEKPEVR